MRSKLLLQGSVSSTRTKNQRYCEVVVDLTALALTFSHSCSNFFKFWGRKEGHCAYDEGTADNPESLNPRVEGCVAMARRIRVK